MAICVAGKHSQYDYNHGEWADWNPETKTVHFGGDWWAIEDYQCESPPTEDDVMQVVNAYFDPENHPGLELCRHCNEWLEHDMFVYEYMWDDDGRQEYYEGYCQSCHGQDT